MTGIHRVRREALEAVAEGRQAWAQFVTFSEADGMVSSESNWNSSQYAGCRTKDGRLWFATIHGVAVIDPKTIHVNELPPPVVIEEVRVDGEVVMGDPADFAVCRPDGVLELGEGAAADVRRLTSIRNAASNVQNINQSLVTSAATSLGPGRAEKLEIRFTANSFMAPERVRFRYKLNGHDKDWHEGDSRKREVTYTNLRPGDYTFRVTACNNHGAWNDTPAEFAFSLPPRFTQTLWFPVSLLMGGAAVALALALFRLRWQRRVLLAQQNAAVAGERARIARDLHDDLGASLTGIALELEAAKKRGRAEGAQLSTLAGEARSLAHCVRELAWTANPRCDNAGSLGAFLGEVTERFCSAAGLESKLELPTADDSREVPARIRHELLSVAKESLANVAKHAGARKVTLKLAVADGELHLTVRDDGRGFDPERTNGGSGLENLRERREQAGGSFIVMSQRPGGTTVTVRVPLRAKSKI